MRFCAHSLGALLQETLNAMFQNQAAARLIIVCGLPGSGKTTHARQLERRLRAVRFCPDESITFLGSGFGMVACARVSKSGNGSSRKIC
jgi:AAA domain